MTVNDHSFHYRVLLISSIVIVGDGFILPLQYYGCELVDEVSRLTPFFLMPDLQD